MPRNQFGKFYKNNEGEYPLYYATINKVKDDCQLVVGFNVSRNGTEEEVSDIRKSYTYESGVENIDDFARTLLSHTKIEIIQAESLKHTDSKTDLRKWCMGKEVFGD